MAESLKNRIGNLILEFTRYFSVPHVVSEKIWGDFFAAPIDELPYFGADSIHEFRKNITALSGMKFMI